MFIPSRIKKVFSEAHNNGFMFQGSTLVEAHKNNAIFMYLDDSVLQLIEISDNPDMGNAKSLIKAMKERAFWMDVWESETDFTTNVIDCLQKQFGDNFVTAIKEIKQHKVPDNVPLYNADGVMSTQIS